MDAIYFTVTTAATVGYGDINLAGAPPWLKLYASLFMILSGIGLALLFALAADAVIGARILQALGVPPRGMRGHVVVVGLGNTGHRIVQHLLDAGVEVAAAEVSEQNRHVGEARERRTQNKTSRWRSGCGISCQSRTRPDKSPPSMYSYFRQGASRLR